VVEEVRVQSRMRRYIRKEKKRGERRVSDRKGLDNSLSFFTEKESKQKKPSKLYTHTKNRTLPQTL